MNWACVSTIWVSDATAAANTFRTLFTIDPELASGARQRDASSKRSHEDRYDVRVDGRLIYYSPYFVEMNGPYVDLQPLP